MCTNHLHNKPICSLGQTALTVVVFVVVMCRTFAHLFHIHSTPRGGIAAATAFSSAYKDEYAVECCSHIRILLYYEYTAVLAYSPTYELRNTRAALCVCLYHSDASHKRRRVRTRTHVERRIAAYCCACGWHSEYEYKVEV